MRPTKLNPQSQAAIVEAVLHGCTYAVAAEAAGVSYDTFNEWMKAGRETKKGKFYEFSEAVTRANAECAKNFTRVIQTAAAKGDWKAAESWLKRRYPREWGDAMDVTTDGKAINPYMNMPAAELLAIAEKLVNANKSE